MCKSMALMASEGLDEKVDSYLGFNVYGPNELMILRCSGSGTN